VHALFENTFTYKCKKIRKYDKEVNPFVFLLISVRSFSVMLRVKGTYIENKTVRDYLKLQNALLNFIQHKFKVGYV